jgi:hypothetical protein
MARIRIPLQEAQRRAMLSSDHSERLRPGSMEYFADYAAPSVADWARQRVEEFKHRRREMEAAGLDTPRGLRVKLADAAEHKDGPLKLLGRYRADFIEPIREAATKRRAAIAPSPRRQGDAVAQALDELREENSRARLLAVWLSGNGNAGALVRDSLINGAPQERELAYRTLTSLSRAEMSRLGLRPAIQGPARADDQPRTVQQASELDELLGSFAQTHAPELYAEAEQLDDAAAQAELAVARAEHNIKLIAEITEPRDPGQSWAEALAVE